MSKLTIGQVAMKLNISSYTLKRWYSFWEILEQTDVEELNNLVKSGMPVLPKYEIFGKRGDKVWDEDDIEDLKAFRNWVPHTKNGIFNKYIKEEK